MQIAQICSLLSKKYDHMKYVCGAAKAYYCAQSAATKWHAAKRNQLGI